MGKWYLKISTLKGTFLFPFNGYKTKREATSQAELAKRDPQTIKVEIVKAGSKE